MSDHPKLPTRAELADKVGAMGASLGAAMHDEMASFDDSAILAMERFVGIEATVLGAVTGAMHERGLSYEDIKESLCALVDGCARFAVVAKEKGFL